MKKERMREIPHLEFQMLKVKLHIEKFQILVVLYLLNKQRIHLQQMEEKFSKQINNESIPLQRRGEIFKPLKIAISL